MQVNSDLINENAQMIDEAKEIEIKNDLGKLICDMDEVQQFKGMLKELKEIVLKNNNFFLGKKIQQKIKK